MHNQFSKISLIGLFLTLTLNALIGQNPASTNLTQSDKYIFGGGKLQPRKAFLSNVKCVSYLFVGLSGDSLQLVQYGKNPYLNIGNLGESGSSCICIGDTVVLQAQRMSNASIFFYAEKDQFIREDLERWGEIDQMGKFQLKTHHLKRGMVRHNWGHDFAIIDGYACYIRTPDLKKMMTGHGGRSDNCYSCHAGDPNL